MMIEAEDALGEQSERVSETANAADARYRYRATFAKQGSLRYVSHLDLARVWERVLRRAGAPLTYSQGFNPRPKIQLASGLPLGYESTCEIVDFWLTNENQSLGELRLKLNDASPEGLTTQELVCIDPREPALQSVVEQATYSVALGETEASDRLSARIETFLAQRECLRVKRGKEYDLRPLVENVRLVDGTSTKLEMTLALSGQKGTARPDEVLEALGLDPITARVTRTAIIIGKAKV